MPRFQEQSTCTVCHTEITRRQQPGARWHNFYGRDECKLAPEDGMPHTPAEITAVRLKPEVRPPWAEITLTVRTEDGATTTITQGVDAGMVYSVIEPKPVTLTGWRLEAHPERLIDDWPASLESPPGEGG
jgi:hypothetical protein